MAKKVVEPIKKKAEDSDMLTRIDAAIEKRKTLLFFVITGFSLLVSILLFDIKISIGGDDAEYLARAFRFQAEGVFPAFQGPLYPMLLSIFIKYWGIKVPLLKSFSIVFMLIHTWFFYKTFDKRIPNFVLLISTLFVAVNAFIQYYASQTYTEAFYFMLQILLLYFVFKLIDDEEKMQDIKASWMKYLLIGFLTFTCVITKNIAMYIPIAMVGYFVFQRKWLSIVYTVGSFGFFYAAFNMFKKARWPKETAQMSSQGNILLYKDPYDFSKGKEEFGGYIDRLTGNIDIYLSKHLLHIFNLKNTEDLVLSSGSAWLILILLTAFTFWHLKSNKFLFLTGLLTLSGLLITFIVLQLRWDSMRLFIIFVPFIVVMLLSGLYKFFKLEVLKMIQPLYLLIILFMTIAMLYKTSVKMGDNYAILKRNLAGDKYYGYTEDWQNFLKMSEYCATNLPKESFVLSRKPAMSMIYANGKPFYGLFSLPSQNADSLLMFVKQNKITHIIHGSLRQNPLVNNGQVITTTNNFLYYISQKYPQKLKQIHTIGEVEPAYLFEIYPDK